MTLGIWCDLEKFPDGARLSNLLRSNAGLLLEHFVLGRMDLLQVLDHGDRVLAAVDVD